MIALCTAMMIVEIVGGHLFGSIALVADGWHMSTHAGALLLAALAYTLARRRANDPRYTFGTGKFGDLAGFSSAIVLGMIALLIGFESVSRLFAPQNISFREAIPIAALGLIVNVASAWLLSVGGHDHAHSHDHSHPHPHDHPHAGDHPHAPHAQDGKMHRDNNMRAAVVHVMADAAVSVMVILGLLAARTFHWLWIDPLAGLVGAFVIASWSLGLLRDTGAILLDMCPDRNLEADIRAIVERGGDEIGDLHVWRLGPGHLGAIVSVNARTARTADDYRKLLEELPAISHLTIEVNRLGGETDGRAAA